MSNPFTLISNNPQTKLWCSIGFLHCPNLSVFSNPMRQAAAVAAFGSAVAAAWVESVETPGTHLRRDLIDATVSVWCSQLQKVSENVGVPVMVHL